MSRPEISRRDLLKGAAFTGAGLALSAGSALARSTAANGKLNVGIIGVDGRGGAHVAALGATENLVALCDVDEVSLAKAGARFPAAARYTDFRRMLERRDLDAVVVGTADHTHFPASMMALDLGKHVYCEKPLTHSVWEARQLARAAGRAKVATQMGNQGHSNDGTRRVVELVQSGAVGAVREVHCWTDRPIWPQGIDRPAETSAVPGHVHWDLWLGPAPERPYHPAYHPFKWRGFWDFGTGALGDMACHVMDTAFWALKLGSPTSVEAEGEPHHPDSAPKWAVIRYEFPERGSLPPVKLTWYDGGRKPPAALAHGEKLPDNGTILVGERGTILLPDAYGSTFVLLPKERFSGFVPPARTIPNSPGHHAEWVAACKSGGTGGSNFQYAGALTEMVLLGNVAFRVGHKIYWDARKLKARNCTEADRYIRRDYRSGWSF